MDYVLNTTPSNQIRLTNVAYVRLTKKGKRFEIACYRNKVMSWRNKTETDLDEVLQSEQVFTNVSKGNLASAKSLLEAFETSDTRAVCREILDKGEMQVTEKERAALQENIFKDIARIISDKTVNPETDRPYTSSMIQNAMKQIQYSVHMSKSSKSQALEVIRKLREVMPIARAHMLVRVTCSEGEMNDFLRETTGPSAVGGAGDAPSMSSSSSSSNSTHLISRYIDEVQQVHSVVLQIDPEQYRRVQEVVTEFTTGGSVEVISLRAQSAVGTATGKEGGGSVSGSGTELSSPVIATAVAFVSSGGSDAAVVASAAPATDELAGDNAGESIRASSTASLSTLHSGIKQQHRHGGGKLKKGIEGEDEAADNLEELIQAAANNTLDSDAESNNEDNDSGNNSDNSNKGNSHDALDDYPSFADDLEPLQYSKRSKEPVGMVKASQRRKAKKEKKKAGQQPIVVISSPSVRPVRDDGNTEVVEIDPLDFMSSDEGDYVEDADDDDGDSTPVVEATAMDPAQLRSRAPSNATTNSSSTVGGVGVGRPSPVSGGSSSNKSYVNRTVAAAAAPVVIPGETKGKRAKRLEKELLAEQQKNALKLKARLIKQQHNARETAVAQKDSSSSSSSSSGADVTAPAAAAATTASVAHVAGAVVPAAAGVSSKCNTCGGSFVDKDTYRAHFKSEWHRHNLNRKLKGKPIVPSEAAFLSLSLADLII